MSRRWSVLALAVGVLTVLLMLASRAVPAAAAPGGLFVGTGVDVTVEGSSVSMGYEIPSPREGCAARVGLFGASLQPGLVSFRVVGDATLGQLAGRATPNEPVTVIGYWDGFAQTATAGVITTEPQPGTACTPLRRTWFASGGGTPVVGANIFSASGPATLAGQAAPSGTVQVSTNEKGEAIDLLSVSLTQGACNYDRSTRFTDYGAGTTNPLALTEGVAFTGATGFGTIAVVTFPGGARGGIVISGSGDCPTIALTFDTASTASTPTATATPTPTPTATATATPAATATPSPAATSTPAPAATTAAPAFIGTPVFGVSGQALAVFSGGSAADLEARAQVARATGVWAQDAGGAFQLLVVGGPSFINDAFRTAFKAGIGVNTPVTLTK